MPTPYALFKNNLTPDPTDYAAVVQNYRSVDFEEIAERIIGQGSTVNKPDILSVLDDSVTAVESILLEGNRVIFGDLAQFFPRVRGVFRSASDEFDPSRHKLDVGANPGRRVRKTVREKGNMLKVDSDKPRPKPTELTDIGSGQVDSTLTPGSIANITCKRLQFNPDPGDEGVFLLPVEGGTATQVTTVSVNEPTFLSFLIPDLAEGEYKLEVRARMNLSNELRSGKMDAVLEVMPT